MKISKLTKILMKITGIAFISFAILGAIFLRMGVQTFKPVLEDLRKEYKHTRETYSTQLEGNVFTQTQYITPNGFEINIKDVIQDGDFVNINFTTNGKNFNPEGILDDDGNNDIPELITNNDKSMASLNVWALSESENLDRNSDLYEGIISDGMFTDGKYVLKFEPLASTPQEMKYYSGCFISTPMQMPNNPNITAPQNDIFYNADTEKVFSVCVDTTKTKLVRITISYNSELLTDNERVYFYLGEPVNSN